MAEKLPIKIFFASSSELIEEREKCILIINELNKSHKHLYLEAVEWEYDSVLGNQPGFNNIQDSINPFIKESQLIVFIFYSKIGQYTLEEFKYAVKLKKKLFVYFKTGFSPNKDNLQSYGELLEFKESIKNSILYADFNNLASFDKNLFANLNHYLYENYQITNDDLINDTVTKLSQSNFELIQKLAEKDQEIKKISETNFLKPRVENEHHLQQLISEKEVIRNELLKSQEPEPTIIIGLGTSGLYILENVQRLFYETYRKNKPDNLQYIYIDTNENCIPAETPLGNEIQRVFISLDNMTEMIAEIKSSCNNPTWVHDPKVALPGGLGAGGIRACGRLALWGKNIQANNFSNVIHAINHAYVNVMDITSNNSNHATKPTVFVTGSLTGGTAGGIFIDIGYLIRHLIQGIKELYGLFLLPKEPTVVGGLEVMYGNAFAALKDLEYYNKIQSRYIEKWPNGFQKEFEVPPYELVQLMSQENQDGDLTMSSLHQLYKMAGLYLFLNIIGLKQHRIERLVDGAGKINSLLGIFGLTAIQFPKTQIQELISSQLSIVLLNRLTDKSQYWLNGHQHHMSRASIKQNATVFFDTILRKASTVLNKPEGIDLLVSIDKDDIRIRNGEIKGSSVEFIISMFTSTSNNNYYSLVDNNSKSILNIIRDGIYEQVDSGLQSTENLYFAKYILEDIVECIEIKLDYWTSIGLSSLAQDWDNKLLTLVLAYTHNTDRSAIEHDSFLKVGLNTIFDLMKIHLSIKTLIDVSNHISHGKSKWDNSDNNLPTLPFLDDVIKGLNLLIDNDNASKNTGTSFPRRVDDIKRDINDTTMPILRVYPSHSFTTECENAMQIYIQKVGDIRSMTEIIHQRNIFQYFREKMSEKFHKKIYLDFLEGFSFKLDAFTCIQDFSVTDYIQRNPNVGIKIAKKASSPFLKVNKVLSPGPYLPRCILGRDSNEIGNVLSAFQTHSFNNFNNGVDSIKALPELKNIIIFYDEKIIFSSIDDLSYIQLMKDAYENVPGTSGDKSLTTEMWKDLRSAYSTH